MSVSELLSAGYITGSVVAKVIGDMVVLLRTIDSASGTASPLTVVRGVLSRLPPNRRTVDVVPVGGENSE